MTDNFVYIYIRKKIGSHNVSHLKINAKQKKSKIEQDDKCCSCCNQENIVNFSVSFFLKQSAKSQKGFLF